LFIAGSLSWLRGAAQILTAGLPALAVALAGIRAQGNFRSLSKRSAQTVDALGVLAWITEGRLTAVCTRLLTC
jgi:hypothetical protein